MVEAIRNVGSIYAQGNLERLGQRKIELLSWFARGYTYSQTAYEMGIAQKTVEGHIREIFDKVDPGYERRSRKILTGLIVEGIEKGLIVIGDVLENPHLTRRQTEICHFLLSGDTKREISKSLGIVIKTVDHHIAGALREMNARNQNELVAKLTALNIMRSLAFKLETSAP